MTHHANDTRFSLTRAEYYPPESEVPEGDVGIVPMRASYVEVGWDLDDHCQVMLAARGANDGDPVSYEIELEPADAERLAAALARVAATAKRALASEATAP